MNKNKTTDSQNRLESINKSLREQKQKENSRHKLFEDVKIINKLTAAFQKMDIKRFSVVFAVVLATILLFTLIIPALNRTKYVQAYQVYINDKSIGAMENVADLENMLESIYAEHETYYGMEIARDVELSYHPISIESQFLCPSKYYEDILRNNLEVNVVAWVIFVNNSPVIALQRREDAQWVLEQILAPYNTGVESRFDIEFLENVEIKSEAISYDLVADKDTALKIMLYGSDIDIQWHKVVSGESLYSICKSYDLKLSDIKKANPSLAESDKIYSGDRLIVTKINNIVNVKYTEFQYRVEEIPFETTIYEDSSMYETQKRVQQEGLTGLRDIRANVFYINGSEASYEVLSAEPPTREPVNEIVIKGTKPMPNVLILANSGRMPFPLSNYTITSHFGPRDTGIEGASRFHNGIDLAAPYGTPIYAAADGKVSFAGSSGGYGILVKIKHDGGVETRYGHCSKLLVSSGQYVKQGDVIALVGSTGTSSGNHVHFEIRIDGKAVDPEG